MQTQWLTSRLPQTRHTWWWIAAVVTVGLLAILLIQLDLAEFYALLRDLQPGLLALGIFAFAIEATLTAVRIRLFAITHPTLGAATLANAWYVMLVLLLPARLGEVAAIVVFERFLGLSRGAAIASIVAQRMFDLIVIALLFVIASLIVIDMQTNTEALPIALVVIAAGCWVILNLNTLLACGSRILHGYRRPARGLRRLLLRLILQGRTWHRHFMTRSKSLMAFCITVAKWIATMAGIALVLQAVRVPIDTISIWAASAVYNFSAIVPLHTVGGLGMGEVGLTAVLVGMGVTLASAVGLALFVRVILILFTLLYFSCVIAWRAVERLFE